MTDHPEHPAGGTAALAEHIAAQITDGECGQTDPILGWHPCTEPELHEGNHRVKYSVHKVALGITEHYTLEWALNGVEFGEQEEPDGTD